MHIDSVELDPFLSGSPRTNNQRKPVISAPNSPTKSPTIRKSVKKLEEPMTHIDYMKLEEANPDEHVVLYVGNNGYMDAVFVSPLQLQRQPEESLDELNQSVKISKIFYKSHAIVNTFLLGGAFYQSSDLLSISALYFGWCGVVYGASSIDTNKKYLESQNLDAQRILSRVSVFQCTQACINLLAGVCLLAGGFAEAPEAGYTFGGLALATAVGNSFFFV